MALLSEYLSSTHSKKGGLPFVYFRDLHGKSRDEAIKIRFSCKTKINSASVTGALLLVREIKISKRFYS